MVREDVVRSRVEMDGQQALNELGKLDAEIQETKNRIREFKEEGKDTREMNKRLRELNGRYKELQKQVDLSGMSMRQLQKYQRTLMQEYGRVHPGTQRHKELVAELKRVNAQLAVQRSQVRQTAGVWATMKKEIGSFGMMALGALGANALFGQFQSLVQGSAELSDAISDVQKTTGMAREEVEGMMSDFKAFNTRTPRKELLGMAEVAGRLGIQGRKDILGFVSAADKINVALGDVLGDTETVMRDMGKLTDVFGLQDFMGIEQALLSTGSALNELGMASSANERHIVDFTRRMAGIAPLAKVSITDIMGLGATLDSLGQTTEVSSTALSKLFIQMAKNAETYARFAKMEVQDFVNLLNKDANEAFLRMLEGVRDNSQGITELAESLGDLGLDGGRVVGILGVLANNTDKVRSQQKLATEAFKEGTSVTEEFALKNENLAGNLSKVQKWFNAVWMNSAIRERIENTVGAMAKMVEIPVSETLQKQRLELNALVISLMGTNEGEQRRSELIDQIQKNYPDFLKNMDTENLTLESLRDRLNEVNKEMIERIMLQIKQEELQDTGIAAARKQLDAREAEFELQKRLIFLAESRNMMEQIQGKNIEEQYEMLQRFDVAQGNTISSRTDDLFKRYRSLQVQAERAKEEWELVNSDLEELSKTLGNGTPIPSGNNDDDDNEDDNPVPLGLTDDQKKALEAAKKAWQKLGADLLAADNDLREKMMERDALEIKRIEDKYAKLEMAELEGVAKIREIRQLTADEQQLHDDRMHEIDRIRAEEVAAKRKEFADRDLEARKDAQRQIEYAQMDAQQQEISKVTAHYTELISLANKYGFDTAALVSMQEAEIAAIREKYREEEQEKEGRRRAEELQAEMEVAQAKAQILQGFSNVFTNMVDLIGNESNRMTGIQKTLALFAIAADTAMAISKANVLAAQAAITAGPAAPFVYFSSKVAIISSILGAAARARQILAGGSQGGSTAGAGGAESSGGIGTGFTERGSATIPARRTDQATNYTVNNPGFSTANVSNTPIGNLQRNVNSSAPNASRSTVASSSNMDAQIAAAVAAAIAKNPVKAYVVYDEYKNKGALVEQIKRESGLGG